MCTIAEIKDIKHRLGLMETQIRAIQQDMIDYKGMVNEHLKKDKKRTLEFRKREDFFIESVIKITGAAEKMELAFNGLVKITNELQHG